MSFYVARFPQCMKDTPDMETPSKIWYVGHLFLWVITGLVCYVVWKDKNAEAARKHLIHSIWLGLILPILAFGLGFAASLVFGIEV